MLLKTFLYFCAACTYTVNYLIIAKNRRIGVKDIAILAGVSIGTVDRVIHNRGEVSEATRLRILKIIDEVNFEPDILASTLASKKEHRLAALIPAPNPDSDFWKSPKSGIDKAMDSLSHYSVSLKSFTFNQFDKDDFKKQIKAIMKDLPDGVLFTPVFYDESVELIDFLYEHNIPFIFVNSTIDHPKCLSFVGQDSKQSGYVAGKLMSLIIPDYSDILIVNISLSIHNHKHILKRQKGFEKYFVDHNCKKHNIEILNIHDTSEENTMAIIKSALVRNNNIKGIFVTNSKVFKICRVLEEAKNGMLRIIGYDLLEDNVNYLKLGMIDFLISQKPIEQGYNGIISLFNHVVLKKQIKEKQFLPIDIITKENIQYYLDN